jgi:hypothetical protein
VALVNSPPPWADPVAWRAAVLSIHEYHRGQGRPLGQVVEFFERHIADGMRGGMSAAEAAVAPVQFVSCSLFAQLGGKAYCHALAPAAKVAPERHVRGPVIVCDSHEED